MTSKRRPAHCGRHAKLGLLQKSPRRAIFGPFGDLVGQVSRGRAYATVGIRPFSTAHRMWMGAQASRAIASAVPNLFRAGSFLYR